MKNKEKYAMQIVELALHDCEFGVSKENGEITPCFYIPCEKCIFNHEEEKGSYVACFAKRNKWANAENKDPKIFTEREDEEPTSREEILGGSDE